MNAKSLSLVLTGLIAGIAITLAAGYWGAPRLMFVTTESPLGHDQTVEAIQTAASASGWKIPTVHRLNLGLKKLGHEVAPVSVMPPAALAVPEPAPLSVPEISAAPAPLADPQEDIVEPTVPEAAGAVSAPPRPATILNDGVDALPQPVTNRSEAVDVPPLTPSPQARPPQSVVEGAPAVEADPLRVTILAPARVDQKVAEELASDVQNVGHELVRVKDVQFNINQRNLRYFHETDRASAARMAERYDAELRDFTWFRPRPAEGTAELWLAGRAPGGGASRSDRPAEPEGILGRVFESLGLGTELPKALPRILPNRNSGN